MTDIYVNTCLIQIKILDLLHTGAQFSCITDPFRSQGASSKRVWLDTTSSNKKLKLAKDDAVAVSNAKEQSNESNSNGPVLIDTAGEEYNLTKTNQDKGCCYSSYVRVAHGFLFFVKL